MNLVIEIYSYNGSIKPEQDEAILFRTLVAACLTVVAQMPEV